MPKTKPTGGIFGCVCAEVASGQTKVAPPTSAMNSRRRMTPDLHRRIQRIRYRATLKQSLHRRVRDVGCGSWVGIPCTRLACLLFPRIAAEIVALPKLSARCASTGPRPASRGRFQARSMAKAATQLRVTQPSVSKAISDLESALRVRLFDRSPQGVEPTMYGHALLTCGAAVFDELKQGIRNLEFLADPTAGELRIGCMESLSATLVPQLMMRFAEQHPKVTVHIDDLTPPALDFSGLRDRRYDCALVRLNPPHSEGYGMDGLHVERLFEDRLVIAAGGHGRWTRRRKIDLSELSDEPWIFTPPGTWGNDCVAQAFRARGLKVPTPSLMSLSIVLRARLLAAGPYLTVFAKSVMRLNADRYGLVVLPIDLPSKPWPVVIVSLKHRTLSPLVERFIACAREVAQFVADTGRTRRSGSRVT